MVVSQSAPPPPPHVKIVLVSQVCVVLVITLGSGPVDTSPHLLPPLHVATAVLAAVIVVAFPFLLPPLIIILILHLLTEKCLVGHSKEMHRGNIDYVIVIVIVLLPFPLLHVIPISVVVVIVTSVIVVVLRLLV